jgi:hypothetical protein
MELLHAIILLLIVGISCLVLLIYYLKNRKVFLKVFLYIFVLIALILIIYIGCTFLLINAID